MHWCCCGSLTLQKSTRNRNRSYGNNFTDDDRRRPKPVNEIYEDIAIMTPHADKKEEDVSMSAEINNNSGWKHPGKLSDTHNNFSIKSILRRGILFDDYSVSDFESKEIRKRITLDRKSSIISRRGSLYISRNADDIIITPFAQILASLRKVRANFMLITSTESSSDKRHKTEDQITPKTDHKSEHLSKDEDSPNKIASETLNELEWCLDHLENIQTHRSVSDMASTKFKQIINRELSQYAETSKAGHQISDYICKTFLDSPLDDNTQAPSEVEREREETDNIRRNELSKYGPKFTKSHTAPVLSKTRSSDQSLQLGQLDSGTENTNDELHLQEDNLPMLGLDVPNEEEVMRIIDQNLLKWGMDLFHFTTITMGQSLAVISFAIFKHHNLINKFQINSKLLLQFLVRVEKSYRSTVPYHNSIHAADVTQSANVLLNGPALDNVFSDLEILSVIFACIVHDVDHPGVTNQYLVNTNSELAILYNDSSVLENHHLSMAFTLLANKDCDFLAFLSRRQRQSMRRMVIDMVLATDMSKHMTLLADLKTMVETKKVAGSGILTLDTYTDRIQILQNLVHCSDLSNPTKPLLLYQIWTERIMEEFFLQGDKEKANDLEISPMCDRQTATVEKSQVSFIDFIVHPLWETWSELVYPDSQGILDTLEENREWYFNMSQEKEISAND